MIRFLFNLTFIYPIKILLYSIAAFFYFIAFFIEFIGWATTFIGYIISLIFYLLKGLISFVTNLNGKQNNKTIKTEYQNKIFREPPQFNHNRKSIFKEKEPSWEEKGFEREAKLWGLSENDKRIAKEERMSPADFIEAEERDDDELITDEWE